MADIAGKVYLVGSGPGDPGLVTVRGAQLLQQCDAVVYDNLIPRELLLTAREDAEQIYVGKKAADHAMPQDDINQLLVTLARQGKSVVRLKGGDPLTFGRGGEEASHLKKHNITFEVVPGITAGSAGLAYAGIPPTDRRKASAVIYVTGHKAAEGSLDVDWEWLGRAKNTTIVIYMGVAELPVICDKLQSAGMSPGTPAAIIERATTASQRVIRTTLAALPDETQEQGVKPPSLFVLGAVTDLQDAIDWFGSRPLSGKRVLVTRPADQAADMYERLRELGAEVIALPTIATRVVDSHPAWKHLPLTGADDRWLVLTSENGVRYFMSQFLKRVGDARRLAGFRIAAVGFGTARALDRYQLSADFVPSRATTAALAQELADFTSLKGARVVRVRGNLGDRRIEEILEGAGAEVLSLPVYETYFPAWSDHQKQQTLAHPPDCLFFTSGSSAQGFFDNLEAEAAEALTQCTVVSIGPSTSATIKSLGLHVTVEAIEHSIPGSIDALLTHLAKGNVP